MHYLNVETTILHATEYIGSPPLSRATWLNVSFFSALRENGGRIIGARQWSGRQWEQTCGVTKDEVDGAAPLLVWEGDDLIVWNYPAAQEAAMRAQREAGRIGGRRSGLARSKTGTPQAPLQGSLQPPLQGSLQPPLQGSLERNGNRKSKRKEEVPSANSPLFLPFVSAAFQSAWEDFTKHRSEIRKPLKPTSTKMALAELQAMGERRAIIAIKHTIAKGWQGIREPEIQEQARYARMIPAPSGPAPLPEPKGWREYLEQTRPGNLINAERRSWSGVDRDVQLETIEALKPKGAA